MIPVKQIADNDCFTACVASMLEIPISTVPNWREDGSEKEQFIHARNWLMERFRLALISVEPDQTVSPPILLIGAVPSLNKPGIYHAVVGEWNALTFTVVHDPSNKIQYEAGQRVEPERLHILTPVSLAESRYAAYKNCIHCSTPFLPTIRHEKVCSRECGLNYVKCLREKHLPTL